MRKRFSSIGHPYLMHCINALTDLYQKQYNTTYAFQFCFEQLLLHEKCLFKYCTHLNEDQ
jgi:hypothetical protein